MPAVISAIDEKTITVTGTPYASVRRAYLSVGGAWRGRAEVKRDRVRALTRALDLDGVPWTISSTALQSEHDRAQVQISSKVARLAGTDAETMAQATLNQLLSGRGKGPSKFDAPGLARMYYSILEHGGLTDEEWADLVRRTGKYKR